MGRRRATSDTRKLVAEGESGSLVAFGRDGSFLARQLTRGCDEGMLNCPSQMCASDRDEVFCLVG